MRGAGVASTMRAMALLPFMCPGSMVLAQTWTQLPDFPGTARDDAASFSIGDRIHVGTGMEVGWSLTNDWYAFDASTDTWTPIASLPAEPRQYSCAFVANGKGYVFGGLAAGGALNDLWEYDPLVDQWTSRAPLPAAGRYAAVATCANGAGIAFVATGMLDGGVPTNETWKYDAAADSWSPTLPVPGPPRHRAAAAAYPLHGFVVYGGADPAFNALTDIWRYSEDAGGPEWLPDSSLPAPRYGSDARPAPYLVIGGAFTETDFHDQVWTAGPSGWSAWPEFAGGSRRGAVIGWDATLNNTYYGTGLDGSLTRHNDWWRLTTPVGIAGPANSAFDLCTVPGTGALLFRSAASGPILVMISDPAGRTVLVQRSFTNTPIPTSALSIGTYVVSVIGPSNRRCIARWTKF